MCTNCTLDINPSEAFAEKILAMYNGGALAMMISIGHRSGLFDTMNGMDPATSSEIAAAAGLNERYVREWLGAMVAGEIVNVDPDGCRYQLPAEHAGWLTRVSGANNIAVYGQYFSVLGSVEDQVLDCFRKGGGVPYSEYRRFHEVMAEDSGQTTVSSLVDVILPIVPGIVDALESGADVLDIGCGRGRALNLLARTFPNSSFVGYDLSAEAIAFARGEAERSGSTNIRFVQRDLSTFDADAPAGAFDFVTSFDAIHDQARPDRVLRGIHRALRPGGFYMMQDIKASSNPRNNMEHPLGAFIYTISCMHCMTVSLAQGGMGLGAAWGKELAQAMLADAGFKNVDVRELDHDMQNYYYICAK